MIILVEFEFAKGQFVGLCPKSYFIIDDQENCKRSSKGIPHKIQLTIDTFKDVLLNSAKHRVEFDQLRLNKNKHMSRATLNKRGLTDICLKTRVSDDKVTCSPLTKDGNFV